MELIGSCEYMGCTVEAYFPEPGAEDIWTLWVMVDGRIVAESVLRIEVGSAYGVDESALHQLEQSAEAAVEAYLHTQAVDQRDRTARRSSPSALQCGTQGPVQRNRIPVPVSGLHTSHPHLDGVNP